MEAVQHCDCEGNPVNGWCKGWVQCRLRCVAAQGPDLHAAKSQREDRSLVKERRGFSRHLLRRAAGVAASILALLLAMPGNRLAHAEGPSISLSDAAEQGSF